MSDHGKTLAALLLGAAAGAVLGILFAPDKGEKTRKNLLKFGKQTADELEEDADDAVDYAKRKVDEGKDKASKLAGDIRDKAENVKDTAKSELDEAKGRVKQQFS